MKKSFVFGLLALALTGCGYSDLGIEAVGQVKRVGIMNPIICSQYKLVDFSLGVMRNGVGSMSTQDIYIVVNSEQEKVLKSAMDKGALVRIVYNEERFVFCTDSAKFAVSVDVLK